MAHIQSLDHKWMPESRMVNYIMTRSGKAAISVYLQCFDRVVMCAWTPEMLAIVFELFITLVSWYTVRGGVDGVCDCRLDVSSVQTGFYSWQSNQSNPYYRSVEVFIFFQCPTVLFTVLA